MKVVAPLSVAFALVLSASADTTLRGNNAKRELQYGPPAPTGKMIRTGSASSL